MVTPIRNDLSLVTIPIGNGTGLHLLQEAMSSAALGHGNDQCIIGLVASKSVVSPARLVSGMLLPAESIH